MDDLEGPAIDSFEIEDLGAPGRSLLMLLGGAGAAIPVARLDCPGRPPVAAKPDMMAYVYVRDDELAVDGDVSSQYCSVGVSNDGGGRFGIKGSGFRLARRQQGKLAVSRVCCGSG